MNEVFCECIWDSKHFNVPATIFFALPSSKRFNGSIFHARCNECYESIVLKQNLIHITCEEYIIYTIMTS